jgi:tetratricopeptide (TPR) repeat protein
VSSALGWSTASPAPEEVFAAVTRLLELLSDRSPLVVLVDDLQWADQTFLDLVQFLTASLRDRPILILCLARSELLDEQPSWGGGRFNSTTVLLGPLSGQDSEALVAGLLGSPLRDRPAIERVTTAAEGNPLYLVELLSMLVEDAWLDERRGGWRATRDLATLPIPPSLQAMVGARLDLLEPSQRFVLERASVVGLEFPIDALRELVGQDLSLLDDALEALLAKDLLQPSDGSASTHRFRHLLIRDVAYDGIPTSSRAELHERFGLWLERTAGERLAEYEEIVGYHLEQAHRYLRGLGEDEDELAPLARRAGEHLAAAGHRTFLRNDMRATASLLARALALIPSGHADRSRCHRERGVALMELGDWSTVERNLRLALEGAEEAGDEVGWWLARVELVDMLAYRSPGATNLREISSVADQAIEVFERLGNQTGLARAYRMRGDSQSWAGRWAEAAEAHREGIRHAMETGNAREMEERLSFGAAQGPLPVPEAIQLVEGLFDPEHPYAVNQLALVYSMAGRHDDAREVRRRIVEHLELVGAEWARASSSIYAGVGLIIEERFEEAEQVLLGAVRLLERMGDLAQLSTAAGVLAQAQFGLGHIDDAMASTELGERTTGEGDIASMVMWRGVRAKILAEGASLDDAMALAREAVEIGAPTDMLSLRAESHLDLAHVLTLARRPEEAAEQIRAALGLFEAKQHVMGLARAERLLDAATSAGPR